MINKQSGSLEQLGADEDLDDDEYNDDGNLDYDNEALGDEALTPGVPHKVKGLSPSNSIERLHGMNNNGGRNTRNTVQTDLHRRMIRNNSSMAGSAMMNH